MKRIVIDASVATKWHLDDEEFIDEAIAIKDAFLENKIELIAPFILPVEWANAINIAIKRQRFPEEEWKDALGEIEDMQISVINRHGLLFSAWATARRFDKSIYDGMYIALAEAENCDLITGDRRLFNSVRGHLSCVKWVGDFMI
ncbi:MAG: type II toxin-antitoxin system VapC family toxin [Nitrospirota bacterium]